uniref:Uncharacterized protein n=1 Tax=Salix viminalis TaxID=40686 RepID=A0A6N2MDN6_SALVM
MSGKATPCVVDKTIVKTKTRKVDRKHPNPNKWEILGILSKILEVEGVIKMMCCSDSDDSMLVGFVLALVLAMVLLTICHPPPARRVTQAQLLDLHIPELSRVKHMEIKAFSVLMAPFLQRFTLKAILLGTSAWELQPCDFRKACVYLLTIYTVPCWRIDISLETSILIVVFSILSWDFCKPLSFLFHDSILPERPSPCESLGQPGFYSLTWTHKSTQLSLTMGALHIVALASSFSQSRRNCVCQNKAFQDPSFHHHRQIQGNPSPQVFEPKPTSIRCERVLDKFYRMAPPNSKLYNLALPNATSWIRPRHAHLNPGNMTLKTQQSGMAQRKRGGSAVSLGKVTLHTTTFPPRSLLLFVVGGSWLNRRLDRVHVWWWFVSLYTHALLALINKCGLCKVEGQVSPGK